MYKRLKTGRYQTATKLRHGTGQAQAAPQLSPVGGFSTVLPKIQKIFSENAQSGRGSRARISEEDVLDVLVMHTPDFHLLVNFASLLAEVPD